MKDYKMKEMSCNRTKYNLKSKGFAKANDTTSKYSLQKKGFKKG